MKRRVAVVEILDLDAALRRLFQGSREVAGFDSSQLSRFGEVYDADALGEAIRAIESGMADTAAVSDHGGAVVLKEYEMARAAGETCYAVIYTSPDPPSHAEEFDSDPSLIPALESAALSVHYRYLPSGTGRKSKQPWLTADLRNAVIVRAGVTFVISEAGQPRVLPVTTFAHRALQLVPLSADTPSEFIHQLDALETQVRDGVPLTAIARAAQARCVLTPEHRLGLALVATSTAELLREAGQVRQGIPRSVESGAEWKTPGGSSFTANPLGHDGVAFVFPGVGSPYEGLGADLFAIAPSLMERYERLARGEPARYLHANHIYPRQSGVAPAFYSDVVALAECATSISAVLTMLMRDIFGVKPRSTLGYSLGEAIMPVALGIWPDPALLSERLESSAVFRSRLQGPMRAIREHWGVSDDAPIAWRTYCVRATPAEAYAAVQQEPRVYLPMINSPEESVIAGDAEGCSRLLARLGAASIPMPMPVTLHCEPARPEHDEFVRIYDMATTPGCETLLYSAANYEPVALDSSSLASAIASSYTKTVDFPRLVRRVYAEGARIFLELGGRRNCSTWIERILRDRPHAAIPCDNPGRNGDAAIVRALARLFAHRVPLNLDPLIQKP